MNKVHNRSLPDSWSLKTINLSDHELIYQDESLTIFALAEAILLKRVHCPHARRMTSGGR